MEIVYSSSVTEHRKIRRARTRSNSKSQSPLASIKGLGFCRSPGLSTSIDSGYESDTCPSECDSPPKLHKRDTSPNSAQLPPSQPDVSTTNEQNATTATTTSTTSSTISNDSLLKAVERRRKRKFRKSQSDQLLRSVLKRAQRKVNKQLAKPKQVPSSSTEQGHQQQKQSSSKSTIAGVNPADYKDLKYVVPSSIEKLVRKPSTTLGTGSQQFALIDCRTPGDFKTEHIQGAVNIFNKEAMFRFYSMQLPVASKDLPTAIIFYSNNVINESLKMAYFLRALDLRTNNSRHAKLLFPKIYIVNENFTNFRNQFSGVIVSASQ